MEPDTLEIVFGECETRMRWAIREEKLLIARETEQRRKSLPLELIRGYSEKSRQTYRYMDDSVIGIPLQFFIRMLLLRLRFPCRVNDMLVNMKEPKTGFALTRVSD